MYDGIASDAAAIPANAQLVAGYVDGRYAWSAADWAHFPRSIHVGIAVRPTTNAGIVLDCEPGNCTPAESVDWVLLRRAAGVDPTVYCNELNPTTGWPAVRAAFRARGVAEPHYWVAKYDGSTAIPAGAVAKQYAETARWDLSSVADYWPGVDPAPKPAVAPATVIEEETMIMLSVSVDPKNMAGPASPMRWLYNGTSLIALQDGQDSAGLAAAGIKTAEVSQRFIDHIAARLGVDVKAL
jgi:hypothetical protein